MKTKIIGLGGMVLIASLLSALLAEGFERLPIIGGESIGPAKLGMTEAEIKELKTEDSPCPVEAVFQDGRAVELRTASGGGCATPEGMMASTYSAHFLKSLYGNPEAIKEEKEHYEKVTADWWYYYKLGLAFRVMYTKDRQSIVQMIAVIPKGTSL